MKWTGKAEDVMTVLVEQERRMNARTGVKLPPRPAWFRALFELPLNIAGFGLGAALRALPAKQSWNLHMKAFTALAGQGEHPLSPDWRHSLEGARSLYEKLSDGGTPPALWCLLSHPPVGAEVSALNFELTRRAYEAIAYVRGRPTKPRLLVAVDPFAMDATPVWQEGIYPGLMTSLHLALDRQPSVRGPFQRLVLSAARPERLAWRLLRELRSGGDVVMILGGGIEPNARILYPGRELLARWRRAASKRGAAVRGAQREALAALAEGEPSAAETGELTAEAETALRLLGKELGLPAERIAEDLEDFRDEFARKNPFRRRLFRVVARRIVAKGRPVLALPIWHGSEGKTLIRLGEAAALTSEGGELKIRMWDKGKLTESLQSPEDFSRRWIGSHFD